MRLCKDGVCLCGKYDFLDAATRKARTVAEEARWRAEGWRRKTEYDSYDEAENSANRCRHCLVTASDHTQTKTEESV